MNGFKKVISVILGFSLLALMLAGCGKTAQGEAPQALAFELKSYFAEDIQWTELKRENVSTHFGFDGTALIDFSALIGDSEGSNDIIAVFVFPDKQAQLSATEEIGKSLIGTPAPQSENKTKSVLVLNKDNETVVVVSSNTEKISKMLNEKGYKV